MSLRAIKKRENTRPYKKHPIPSRSRKISASTADQNLSISRQLSKSYPDLSSAQLSSPAAELKSKLTSKSDSDLHKLAKKFEKNANLISAKSEICLKTISVHSTEQSPQRPAMGARSERDLSKYLDGQQSDDGRRRMSEYSISAYSNRTSAMSDSEYNGSSARHGFADTSCVRVPIIGYEVMEERARFTVYKLRVENPFSNDCWLVLRRYTDFVRLNTKLKQIYPMLNLQLPRKKIFGDNFNSVFLDNRVQGLQMFVNSIMCKEELKTCKIVREFFCLDEPPSYSESMEECRAIFEAQEETIVHLKMQINSKNDLIMSLQQKLRSEMTEKEQLIQTVKSITDECSKCSLNPVLADAVATSKPQSQPNMDKI